MGFRFCVFFLFVSLGNLFSATRTWTGGGGNNNWTTAANWGGTAPVAGDDLIFDGSTRLNNTNNFTAGTSFRSITIAAGAGSFTLAGNAIVLSGGAVAYSNLSTNNQTVSLDITFSTSAATISETSTISRTTFSGSLNNGGRLLTISNAGTTNASTMIIGGVISGSGGLTKTGNGFVNITNSNTYSGVTTISGGRINASVLENGGSNSSIGSSSNSASNLIIDGGTLRYVGSTTASTNRLFTIGTGGAILYSSPTGGTGITYSNTGTVVYSGTGARTLEFGGGTAGSNNFNCNLVDPTGGALSILKSGGNSVWQLSGTNTFSGDITIVSSAGTSGGTLKVGSTSAFGSSSLGIVIAAAGGAIDLNGFNYASAEPITINGTGVSNTGAITNSSSTPATFGGLITLAASSSIIAYAGDITLSNTGTITGATFDLTLGGAFNGSLASAVATTSGGLIKQDAGVWTLTNANTYNGATTISSGTLKVGNASALGSTTGSTTIASGAVLDLNGINYSNAESLTVNGTGISNGGAVLNSSGTAATFAGLITLGSASSIVASAGNITLSNTGTITGATFGLILGGTFNGTVSSIIGTTSGTLTKQGTGTWTLSRNNTYTGLTTISSGTIKLGSSSALGTTASGTIVSSDATLDLNGINYSTSEALTLNGTGVSNNGALTNSSASASTFAGLITLQSASSIIASSGDINITNTGTITGVNIGLTLGGAFNGVLTSRLGTTTGTLTKNDNGTWTLSGTNSYSGATTINAGVLKLGKSNVIADNSDVIILGTLDMNSFNETLGSIAGSGVIDNIAGGGNPTLSVGANDIETTFSGQIKNTTGTLSLTKVGTATLRLSGNNSYSGITNLSSGIISAQHENALGNTIGETAITTGTSLILYDYPYASEFLTIKGSGNASIGALSTSSTLTSGTVITFPGPIVLIGDTEIGGINSGVELNLTGVIDGNYNLTKTVAGTLTLSGLNTYAGTTTISAGILKLGSVSALGTTAGSTSISNNAALDLNGINYSNAEPLSIVGTGVSASGVVYNSNATAATFSGAITMTGASTINANNQITLSGNISPNTQDLTKNGSSSLVFTSNTVSVRDLTLSSGTLNAGASTINISRSFTSTATFTRGTSTVNFVGTNAQVIPALNYYNVTLNNASATTSSISGDITVEATISLLDGELTTGANLIDLGSTGIISEVTPNALAPTSYVTGNVKATRNTGNTSGTVSFGGLGLDITETTQTDNSTVVIRTTGTSKTYTIAGTTYYGIERFFDITPAIDINLNGTMVMHYFEHELGVCNEAHLKIYKDSTSGWVLKKASSVNTAANTLTLSNIKDFSLWTASDYIFQPLPITLARFGAEKNQNTGNVDLKWTTVSETNNDYFSLEKSYDGVDWVVFGKVDGAGTSTKVLNYIYEDSEPFRGIVYYRLKQTDFDGKFEYSQIVVFESDSPINSSTECTLYPMPSSVDNINLLLSTKDFGTYNIRISNIHGVVLMSKNFEQNIETDVVDLSNQLKDLSEGLYILELSKEELPVCTSKFILE